ncbi:MAG TPA: ABC transporter permease [Candidatus Polarisedimenticolia bacterium]|nr:ABC transporter permease [Candidatus Polarisedimenticolia bacterium]
MKKAWAVARKEVRQIVRDPLTMMMLLGVPAFMLLLYGYALNFDVRHIRLAVQDRDRSAASRSLVASFVNSTYFDLALDLPAGADLERVTLLRQAMAILVIPEEYSRQLAAGRKSPVQLILDGTDAATASTVLGYASALVAEANAELVARSFPEIASSRASPSGFRPRVWYNPELRSTNFLVPGLMGFILMLTAVLSTALSVVREKERGTLEQIRVTSLRPIQLILGKTLPYLVISLLASGLILVAARSLFGVEVKGPPGALFLATLLYLVGALGFGLLVSTLADSQAMAFQVGALLSMLPAIFLSGFIFPIRSMPVILQAITYAVPARYYLIVLRGVILKGAGLSPYLEPMLFLSLYAAVVNVAAYVRLSRDETAA